MMDCFFIISKILFFNVFCLKYHYTFSIQFFQVFYTFFGSSIFLLIILKLFVLYVPKDIKNDILNAIYKEMGMAKKAQGIAFSLPVTDTAGLVKVEDPAPAEV